MRRLFCCTSPWFSLGALSSGTYVHAFGLNAFLFAKIPANASARLNRVENQNHALSRLMGPPIDSFKSQFLRILVGVANPLALRSSV